MIRFRIGQSWKREPDAAPVDSFGLDVEGVDLLSGASEEPLAEVVPDLVEAVHSLAAGARRAAHVSLAEAHLELVLFRRGDDADVAVVSLGRPARLVRPRVRVDLAELVQAVVRCGRSLVRDLSGVAPALLREPRHRRMAGQLGELERGPLGDEAPAARRAGWTFQHLPSGAPAFGFDLDDPDDVLREYSSRVPWALPSLLVGGRVFLEIDGGLRVWDLAGLPFLSVLELSRQGTELSRALDAGDDRVVLALAGGATSLTLPLDGEAAALGDRPLHLRPAALAGALFEVGLAFSMAAAARHRAQAKNPYLVELAERCRAGLAELRRGGGLPGAAGPPSAEARRRSGALTKPLRAGGRLRRLRFEPLWTKTRLGGEGPGELIAGTRGPIFASTEMACGFSARGQLLYRRVGTHGVATSRDGWVVTASATRSLGFRGRAESASWLGPHDGTALGPELTRREGLLVAPMNGRGLIALSELTGREAWRFEPARTQRGYFAVHGHRVVLATDAGHLFGLDLATGEVCFRVQAALPFAAAPVPWGRKLLSLLTRGERTALFVADAHSGQVAWTHDSTLTAPALPVVIGKRAFVAGRREGHPLLLCLGAQGRALWERPVPLGTGALTLSAVGRDVVVADAHGAAALVGSEGQVEWRLGAAGEELARPVSPRFVRGVLFVPGQEVRAVDARGGSVLAEVRSGPGLCDLEVDSKLNLYLLDDGGTLEAHRLTSHFAVV